MRVNFPARFVFTILVIRLNLILIFAISLILKTLSWLVVDMLTRSVPVYCYKTHWSFSSPFSGSFFSPF